MLEIKNLKASINNKDILKGLNLRINPGEVHAIMGPNGSGKSTLANVLSGKNGYEVSGELNYKGENIKDIPMSIVGFQTRDGEDKEPYWIHNATESVSIEEYAEGQTFLVLDDIYDTGMTMNKVIEFVKKSRNKPSPMPNVFGYCLFGKTNAADIVYSNEHDGSWIVFPWEYHESV